MGGDIKLILQQNQMMLGHWNKRKESMNKWLEEMGGDIKLILRQNQMMLGHLNKRKENINKWLEETFWKK